MNAWTAEESLLAVVMADNALFWRVADTVCEQDFTPENRWLFALVRDTIKGGNAADAVTLGDVVKGDRLRQMMNIAGNAPGRAVNVEAYAKQVQDVGERRRVREAGHRIALADSFMQAQWLLADVRPQQSARLKSATDGLREMVDALQARFDADSIVTGTPTGLASLDEITGGWQAGDLIGVGGSTSMGKTAFALQCAIHAGRCYYASLEMMASQLFERVVSNVGRVPYRYIRFPKEAPDDFMSRLNAAARVAKELPLIVDDQPGLSLDQVSARARQLHMVEPLRLIVVDHLGLMRRPRKHAASELGEIAIGLKNLAKELGVPVLMLVQLNRGSKAGDNKRPELEAFRDSGEIEEALDTAVFVYRDEYHNPEGPLAGRRDTNGEWLPGYAEFIVRKQRQGERNVTAWAKSHLGEMRFESCADPQLSTAKTSGNDSGGGFAAKYGTAGQPGGRPDVRAVG